MSLISKVIKHYRISLLKNVATSRQKTQHTSTQKLATQWRALRCPAKNSRAAERESLTLETQARFYPEEIDAKKSWLKKQLGFFGYCARSLQLGGQSLRVRLLP